MEVNDQDCADSGTCEETGLPWRSGGGGERMGGLGTTGSERSLAPQKHRLKADTHMAQTYSHIVKSLGSK